MNEGNLVSRINKLVTGDYFLREHEVDLISAVRVTASGIPVGAATAPTAVVNGISFDDGETALLTFMVPLDYDPTNDKLAVRLMEVPSASAADTTDLGLTSAQTIFRGGAAADATAATAVAEAATSSSGALVRENVLDLSGGGYQPGDVVRRTLDANNSSTTEIVLLAVSIIYGSTLRMYDDAQNERSLG